MSDSPINPTEPPQAPLPGLLHSTDRDPLSADQLLPLVYDQLRQLAAARLTRESLPHTLQPTALVHEAWIKLAGSRQAWSGRAHFFAAAAEAMRRILIDRARRKTAHKRGDGSQAEELQESHIQAHLPDEQILALNDALDRLSARDELAARVIKLRFFVGMTKTEIADALEISPRSVARQLAYARAWLKDAMKNEG